VKNKIFFFSCFLANLFAEIEQGHPLESKDLPQEYNAPARFEVKRPSDIYISASFIYWQAREGGLEVASAVSPLPTIDSRFISMDFKFNPGFKILFGVNFVHDFWTAYGEYTRLYLTDHTSSYVPNDTVLVPIWLDTDIGLNNPYYVKGIWHLQLNVLDISFSRPYYVGYMTIIDPIFGLKAWWIGQTYNALYSYQEELLVDSYKHTRIWALGPRGGANIGWHFAGGFKITTKACFALLYEHFKTRSVIYIEEAKAFDERYSVQQIAPVIEMATGISWGSYLLRSMLHLETGLSYEFQLFFSQNVLRNYKDMAKNNVDSNIGDLLLQGLTLNLRFDF